MKKIIPVLLVALLISSVAFADGPIKKLGRGLANIVTCPLEVIKGISDANTENGPIAAVTFGLLKGIFNTGVRVAVGAYEVVTFPIPIPRDYSPILTDPEFFLEEGLL